MVFILDGGFSTQLAKYVGESAIMESPLWTARFLHTNPDAIVKTHCDFVEELREIQDMLQVLNTFKTLEGKFKYLGCSTRYTQTKTSDLGLNVVETQTGYVSHIDTPIAGETPIAESGFEIRSALGTLWGEEQGTSSAGPQLFLEENYAAGCDVVLTNTYQASVQGFQLHLGLDRDESLALISQAVKLARQSIHKSNKGKQVLVAGSVGPYGACQNDGSEYRGDYAATMKAADFMDWHRPRITALIQANVDLLAIETIPSLAEACSVVEMLKKEFPDQQFWLSFSCKDNSCISDGTKFSEAAAVVCKIAGNQLVAVGVNCISPSSVTPLLGTAHDLLVPFVVYPNRGEKWTPGKGWSGASPSEPLTNYVAEWVSLGARYIGGCCRTTADDMNLIRQYIDLHNLSEPDQGKGKKVDGQ